MPSSEQKLIFVTGLAQLDAKLTGLPSGIQRKFVKGALKKGAKRVAIEAKRIIRNEAYDTGTLYRSIKARNLKRSRRRVGVAIFPDKDKLFANYAAKHDGKPPHPAKGETEPFYYFATIEFGDANHEAVRPMRRALYDHANVYVAFFHADIQQFIAENRVSVALPKSGAILSKGTRGAKGATGLTEINGFILD